jgi:hypothetical protein
VARLRFTSSARTRSCPSRGHGLTAPAPRSGEGDVDAPWGRVAVVPTRHLSAAFGFRLTTLAVLAEAVAGALVNA